MRSKVPNLSPNISTASGYGESAQFDADSSSDYDETIEYSSENEMTTNDFSEYVWMGEEEEFENQVLQSLEEEELMNDCLEMHETVNELELLDEIKQTEEEIKSFSSTTTPVINSETVAKSSKLNPDAAEFIPFVRC